VWRVRDGREDEFLRLWREGVADLSRQLPDATFRLWRDAHDPLRFESVGGPVESREELDAIRRSGGFRARMDAIADTLESVEMTTYELVDEVG
jgi:hypothetical protein